MNEHAVETAKQVGDLAALGTALGSLFGYMPEIAALAAFLYTCLRIYEWFEKRQKWRKGGDDDLYNPRGRRR